MWTYEYRALRADGLALTVLLALVAALLLGGWNAARERDARSARAEATSEANAAKIEKTRKDLLSLEAGGDAPRPWLDPRRASNVATRGAVPSLEVGPTDLALFGIGAPEISALTAVVGLGTSEPEFGGEDLANPESLLSGRFDPSFVVVFLLPLAAIALAFDLVARDRARGILPLLLATSTSPLRTFGRRYVLRWAALALALLCGILGGAIAFGFPWSTAGAPLLLAAWSGLALVYAAFWIAACACVATLGSNGTAQGLWLASSWVAITTAIPSIAGPWLESGVDAPSRVATAHVERDVGWKAWDDRGQRTSRFLMEHPELRPPPGDDIEEWRNQLEMLSYHAGMDEARAPLRLEFERAASERRQQASLVMWMTPAAALQGALDELSGAGDGARLAFVRDARRFQSEWNEFFVPRIQRGGAFTVAEADSIPRFTPAPTPTRDLLSASATSVFAIALWLVATVAIAAGRLARLSPV